MSTFLASCQTTPDGAKGELVAWMEREGHEVEYVPPIEIVNIPWDKAYYSPDTRVMYVSSRWRGSDLEKSMILHELIHAQQDHPGQCEALEAEAYEVQGRWMRMQGHDVHHNHVALGVVSSCDPMNWQEKNRLMK